MNEELIRDLTDEADQCRNDGANDIADLLDRARHALSSAVDRDSVLEEAAKAIEPGYPRGCDCEWCDCGNSGDAHRVAQWDADTMSAGLIRALKTKPEGGA